MSRPKQTKWKNVDGEFKRKKNTFVASNFKFSLSNEFSFARVLLHHFHFSSNANTCKFIHDFRFVRFQLIVYVYLCRWFETKEMNFSEIWLIHWTNWRSQIFCQNIRQLFARRKCESHLLNESTRAIIFKRHLPQSSCFNLIDFTMFFFFCSSCVGRCLRSVAFSRLVIYRSTNLFWLSWICWNIESTKMAASMKMWRQEKKNPKRKNHDCKFVFLSLLSRVLTSSSSSFFYAIERAMKGNEFRSTTTILPICVHISLFHFAQILKINFWRRQEKYFPIERSIILITLSSSTTQ